MTVDHAKLYEFASDFFELGGNVVMKLTPAAAIEVCRASAERGLVVLGVEGGIREEGFFEARIDCIWDGVGSRVGKEAAMKNNLNAVQFIEKNSQVHNAFILTVTEFSG